MITLLAWKFADMSHLHNYQPPQHLVPGPLYGVPKHPVPGPFWVSTPASGPRSFPGGTPGQHLGVTSSQDRVTPPPLPTIQEQS